MTKITSPTPVIPRSRQGPRSSRWRAPCPRWAFTPTLPHVIYLPIIAYKHDSRVSTIRQPFAVVATSDGFRAAYDHACLATDQQYARPRLEDVTQYLEYARYLYQETSLIQATQSPRRWRGPVIFPRKY